VLRSVRRMGQVSMSIKVAHMMNHDIALRVHGRNYFAYLRERGYDVHAICSPGEFVKGDMVTDTGVVVKAISFPPRYTPGQDLKTLVQLVCYLREQGYDIVHTHTAKPGLLGRIAARLAGVPIVIHTVHGFHYWLGMSDLEKRLFVWLERFAAQFCDLLLSQNREDIGFAVRERICSPEQIHFLGNGIDVTRFRPDAVSPDAVAAKRRELGIAPDEKVVGMIGRLVRLKGYHEYVQAARLLKERGERIRFLAIGVAQDQASVVSPGALISQYGLQDTMQFLGTRHDIPELIAAMDAVVLASYAEGIPRVLLEAAAMGKPAIGTDVRGTREVIVDGETGYLVPPCDALALAEAISRLSADPARRREMGRAARRRAEAHFDERCYFWRTDREYRRLIEVKLSASHLRGLKALPLEAGQLPV